MHLFIVTHIFIDLYIYWLVHSKKKITAWRDNMANVQWIFLRCNASLSHHASLFQQQKHVPGWWANAGCFKTNSFLTSHECVQPRCMMEGSTPAQQVDLVHTSPPYTGWMLLLGMAQMARFSALCLFPDCVVFARIIPSILFCCFLLLLS